MNKGVLNDFEREISGDPLTWQFSLHTKSLRIKLGKEEIRSEGDYYGLEHGLQNYYER